MSLPSFPAIRAMILNTFRAGQLSRTAKDVLLIIGSNQQRPMSFATIAHLAKCSRRSVAYAVQQAEALGIIERTQRRVRRGNRVLRGANAYRFLMRVVVDRFAMPWKRSRCKSCSALRNEDSKGLRKQRSPEDWLAILARLDEGMNLRDAGYQP